MKLKKGERVESNDRAEFQRMLQEMAAMYKGTIYNDFFAEAYWKILKSYRMEAVRRACLDLLGHEMRKQVMPTAAEIKAMARHHEPKPQPLVVDQDEERWRRQYDHWQAGDFSDKALAEATAMSDQELGVGLEEPATWIPCQHPGCRHRLRWPSDSMERLCPPHRADHSHGKPVTREDKLAIVAAMTPKGRAFVRSIVPQLMADIPVTAEEAEYTEGPRRDMPPILSTYLKTVDAATADAILENYRDWRRS